MILIPTPSGQLCNRLFMLAHIITFAYSRGRTVVSPILNDYSQNFETFTNYRSTTSPAKVTLLKGTIAKAVTRFFHSQSKAVRLLEQMGSRKVSLKFRKDSIFFDELPATFSQFESRICLAYGWEFRSFNLLSESHPMLTEIFAPTATVGAANERFLGNILEERKVGLHIRLGDYRTEAPQHVLRNKELCEIVERLKSIFKDAAIVIAANEDVDYLKQDRVYFRKGNAAEDLFTLGACDYIAGPLSTFNRWAAFVGKVPHFNYDRESRPESVADFRQFKAFQPSIKFQDLNSCDKELLLRGGIV